MNVFIGILLLGILFVYVAKDKIPKYKTIIIALISIIVFCIGFTIWQFKKKVEIYENSSTYYDTNTNTNQTSELENNSIYDTSIGKIGDQKYIKTKQGDFIISIDKVYEINSVSKDRTIIIDYTIENISYMGTESKTMNVSSINFGAKDINDNYIKVYDYETIDSLPQQQKATGKIKINLENETNYIKTKFTYLAEERIFELVWEDTYVEPISKEELSQILQTDLIECSVTEVLDAKTKGNNSLQFENYNKKRIKISGTVDSVYRNKFNKIIVTLKDKNYKESIICEFAGEDLKEELLSLYSGDLIKISGVSYIENNSFNMFYCYKVEKLQTNSQEDIQIISAPEETTSLYEPFTRSDKTLILSDPATFVTANEIVSFYKESKNDVALKTKYDKKNIALSGIIKNTKLSDDVITVTLDNDNKSSIIGIECYFTDFEFQDYISTFNVGDRVTVYGIGKVGSLVYNLYNCYKIDLEESAPKIQNTINDSNTTTQNTQISNKPSNVFVTTKTENDGMTMSQRNAVKQAQSYLKAFSFSREGLIDQLSSEYGSNYPYEDAVFAVDYLEKNGLVDWYEQAVKQAQSYLKVFSFSREELIDQLSSEYGSQFTPDQAEYAVNIVYQ